jgi:hypothetical protein
VLLALKAILTAASLKTPIMFLAHYYQVMLQTIPDRGRIVRYLPPKLIVLPYLGMANYNQSLVEMVEHNRIKLVWVPEYAGFDGNETVQN